MPDVSFFKKYMFFDFEKGEAYWLAREGFNNWNANHAGKKIGCVFVHGYVGFSIMKKKFWMHRVVFYVFNNIDPVGMDIDHINGVRNDNRPSNLRIATRSQNNNNQWINRKNTSGYKGVYFNKRNKKWIAQVKESGIQKVLGRFSSAHEAHVFLCSYRLAVQKEFANNGEKC